MQRASSSVFTSSFIMSIFLAKMAEKVLLKLCCFGRIGFRHFVVDCVHEARRLARVEACAQLLFDHRRIQRPRVSEPLHFLLVSFHIFRFITYATISSSFHFHTSRVNRGRGRETDVQSLGVRRQRETGFAGTLQLRCHPGGSRHAGPPAHHGS